VEFKASNWDSTLAATPAFYDVTKRANHDAMPSVARRQFYRLYADGVALHARRCSVLRFGEVAAMMRTLRRE
tara:strand:- start:108441 stop:108656 length:216 start_codon:yes stop_codon:yes gene_type:complete